MTNLRPVSKTEKIIFPIVVTLLVVLIIPDAAPLVGFLMLGTLLVTTLQKVTSKHLKNLPLLFVQDSYVVSFRWFS